MIYKPANARTITCKTSGAYVFIFETAKGHPCAHAYTKNAKRHAVWRFRFLSEDQRAKRVAAFLKGQADHVARKAERRAKQSAPHSIEVGHVFYNSWGYEQTNIDFYEVVRTTPKGVYVRPIASKQTDATGWAQGYVVPDLGAFTGEAVFKRVDASQKTVSMPHGWCGLWNGKPVHYTAYH
ncbi:MAG: hypothetical protein AAFY22_05935 [Pseudomonadota bacterium]